LLRFAADGEAEGDGCAVPPAAPVVPSDELPDGTGFEGGLAATRRDAQPLSAKTEARKRREQTSHETRVAGRVVTTWIASRIVWIAGAARSAPRLNPSGRFTDLFRDLAQELRGPLFRFGPNVFFHEILHAVQLLVHVLPEGLETVDALESRNFFINPAAELFKVSHIRSPFLVNSRLYSMPVFHSNIRYFCIIERIANAARRRIAPFL
jgi:hypothetical protein